MLLTNHRPPESVLTNPKPEVLLALANQRLVFKENFRSLIGCWLLGHVMYPRIRMYIGGNEVNQSLMAFNQLEVGYRGQKGMRVYKYFVWAELKNFKPIRQLQGVHVTCSVSSATNQKRVAVTSAIAVQCEKSIK